MYYHLDFYEPEELRVIVQASAQKLNVALEEEAALEIARRSRGTPRIANRLLRRVRDFAQVHAEEGPVTSAIVQQAMKNLGIDRAGLDEADRRFIRILHEHYKGGPVGVETLAATLNEEMDTIVDVIEPYLLKIGFLNRTPRGRELTEHSRKHILGSAYRPKETQNKIF